MHSHKAVARTDIVLESSLLLLVQDILSGVQENYRAVLPQGSRLKVFGSVCSVTQKVIGRTKLLNCPDAIRNGGVIKAAGLVKYQNPGHGVYFGWLRRCRGAAGS